jgi:hypothetical protein
MIMILKQKSYQEPFSDQHLVLFIWLFRIAQVKIRQEQKVTPPDDGESAAFIQQLKLLSFPLRFVTT